jgi:hypothetical protein
MGAFTTTDQRKLLAGTVGITQRGHLQDAYRPDWLVLDDVCLFWLSVGLVG